MSLTHASRDEDVLPSLDATLRDVVRRDGVDPQRDRSALRRLAERVVREHDQRSLTGAVVPIGDAERMVDSLVANVAGFGALQPYLDDPTVEEIWVNDPSRVFVARNGVHELTPVMLTRPQVLELVERMLKSSGRRIDISQPFVDAMLPGGHRLHVVLEGITRGYTAVNIRKFVVRAASLDDLVALGSLTPQAARFLRAAVVAGLNVLVAGGTQAGKTTMLNALAAAIPGGQRVVSAEEVFELTNLARLQTCERSCTCAKAWTAPVQVPQSSVNGKTVSNFVLTAAGRLRECGRRTPPRRRHGALVRSTPRCSPRSRPAEQTCWSLGTSTG
jgi:pilus assembly protein CpaF